MPSSNGNKPRTGEVSGLGRILGGIMQVTSRKHKSTRGNLGEATNQFYYHTELKRWIERGKEEEVASEPAFQPPPVTANGLAVSTTLQRRSLTQRYKLQDNLTVSSTPLSGSHHGAGVPACNGLSSMLPKPPAFESVGSFFQPALPSDHGDTDTFSSGPPSVMSDCGASSPSSSSTRTNSATSLAGVGVGSGVFATFSGASRTFTCDPIIPRTADGRFGSSLDDADTDMVSFPEGSDRASLPALSAPTTWPEHAAAATAPATAAMAVGAAGEVCDATADQTAARELPFPSLSLPATSALDIPPFLATPFGAHAAAETAAAALLGAVGHTAAASVTTAATSSSVTMAHSCCDTVTNISSWQAVTAMTYVPNATMSTAVDTSTAVLDGAASAQQGLDSAHVGQALAEATSAFSFPPSQGGDVGSRSATPRESDASAASTAISVISIDSLLDGGQASRTSSLSLSFSDFAHLDIAPPPPPPPQQQQQLQHEVLTPLGSADVGLGKVCRLHASQGGHFYHYSPFQAGEWQVACPQLLQEDSWVGSGDSEGATQEPDGSVGRQGQEVGSTCCNGQLGYRSGSFTFMPVVALELAAEVYTPTRLGPPLGVGGQGGADGGGVVTVAATAEDRINGKSEGSSANGGIACSLFNAADCMMAAALPAASAVAVATTCAVAQQSPAEPPAAAPEAASAVAPASSPSSSPSASACAVACSSTCSAAGAAAAAAGSASISASASAPSPSSAPASSSAAASSSSSSRGVDLAAVDAAVEVLKQLRGSLLGTAGSCTAGAASSCGATQLAAPSRGDVARPRDTRQPRLAGDDAVAAPVVAAATALTSSLAQALSGLGLLGSANTQPTDHPTATPCSVISCPPVHVSSSFSVPAATALKTAAPINSASAATNASGQSPFAGRAVEHREPPESQPQSDLAPLLTVAISEPSALELGAFEGGVGEPSSGKSASDEDDLHGVPTPEVSPRRQPGRPRSARSSSPPAAAVAPASPPRPTELTVSLHAQHTEAVKRGEEGHQALLASRRHIAALRRLGAGWAAVKGQLAAVCGDYGALVRQVGALAARQGVLERRCRAEAAERRELQRRAVREQEHASELGRLLEQERAERAALQRQLQEVQQQRERGQQREEESGVAAEPDEDLLLCLGQESAKVALLAEALRAAGGDPDALIARVEAEYEAVVLRP